MPVQDTKGNKHIQVNMGYLQVFAIAACAAVVVVLAVSSTEGDSQATRRNLRRRRLQFSLDSEYSLFKLVSEKSEGSSDPLDISDSLFTKLSTLSTKTEEDAPEPVTVSTFTTPIKPGFAYFSAKVNSESTTVVKEDEIDEYYNKLVKPKDVGNGKTTVSVTVPGEDVVIPSANELGAEQHENQTVKKEDWTKVTFNVSSATIQAPEISTSSITELPNLVPAGSTSSSFTNVLVTVSEPESEPKKKPTTVQELSKESLAEKLSQPKDVDVYSTEKKVPFFN